MGKKKHSAHDAPLPESFGLPRVGVESHAHLNGPKFAEDLDAVMARADKTGLAYIMQVFLSAEAWQNDYPRFEKYPQIYCLLGIHPTDVYDFADVDVELARIAAIIKAERGKGDRIRAMGEMGLDYYWQNVPPEAQKAAFVKQLRLARELELPVVIHCRDAQNSSAATDDTIKILDDQGFAGRPTLWHCFGGGWELAERLLERGWHISIPGPVTFPANQALREAVARIPAERLLMETDCPYLAPMPHRGRRNEPAFLAFSVQVMAQARGVEPAELWASCGQSAIKFFGLPPLK